MYTLQTFMLLKTFCDELNQMVAQFWWGKEQGKRQIHWSRWKSLCKPKGEGGLGFKDIYASNLALLVKQGWWLIQQQSSVASLIFKARYYPQTDFPMALVKTNSSYYWKCLRDAHKIIRVGAMSHPDPGSTTSRAYRSTILSALGPDYALTVLFLGTHTRTSQWVTHPGIA